MKPALVAALAALVVIVIVVGGTFFTVAQTEQALVLYFGEPVRVINKPGLKMKVPFVENVVLLDNRILDLETPQQEVVAADNQRILVDAFVRYRITNPLTFYQSVGTVVRANNQLASVMNSALRRVLGESTLPQIIKEDRAQLMVKIRDLVNSESSRLGLSIDDVRIRRADLPREISEKVFSRMISERAREAAQYRAQGAEQAQTTTADADRQVVVLKADAQRRADELRGTGDAERNRVFAAAFGKDPDFFAFYRSMQAYGASLKGADTRFVISPSSSFFRYFQDPDQAIAPPATPGG
ncbi:protease modulator HflC [Lichenifustis flavocetrariae]|uniref:Protein HflC n=1 Tax=Lichenifustis flavocetrariae TaxID=2949735 RepID=A0AA41Z033_9HYPH|nr:protease modulator HflC [Lichenifustis flavocetrariae]MCW6510466.1 protease modulator HflC [Lichenifustis flavocetrariae]